MLGISNDCKRSEEPRSAAQTKKNMAWISRRKMCVCVGGLCFRGALEEDTFCKKPCANKPRAPWKEVTSDVLRYVVFRGRNRVTQNAFSTLSQIGRRAFVSLLL